MNGNTVVLGRHITTMLALGTMLALALALPGTVSAQASSQASEADSAGERALRGGEESSVLENMTIEEQNRVQVEFERPELALHLDPLSVPGLERAMTLEVLEGEGFDLASTLLAESVSMSPYLGRPWLARFRAGNVARFHPQMERVESWVLRIADSRGEEVRVFKGRGNPPDEIVWDGRSDDGLPAAPGLEYAYTFEAIDVAGNNGTFAGETFELPSYRVESPGQIVLLMRGDEVLLGRNAANLRPPLILEAASWINQLSSLDAPLQVIATARSFEQAQRLSEAVAAHLGELVMGDPLRIQTVNKVEAGAAQSGSVIMTAGR